MTIALIIMYPHRPQGDRITREGFLRKNIVAVSCFQTCAIHPYS